MSNEVFKSISDPFAAALASLNMGLTNAAKEISTLHKTVESKQTKHQLLIVELTNAKTELSAKCAKAVETQQEQEQLEKVLADYTDKLDAMEQQKVLEQQKVSKLEEQLKDIGHWKQKTAIAEQQKANLQNQLSTLRAALVALTMPSPNTKNTKNESGGVGTENSNDAQNGKHIKEEATRVKELPAQNFASAFVSAMDASCVSDVTTDSVAPKQIDSRYKTQLCVFHQRGECQRGAKCLYAHGEHELQFNPGKHHKKVSSVAAMGFGVDIAVIGALFEECDGNTERVLAKLLAM